MLPRIIAANKAADRKRRREHIKRIAREGAARIDRYDPVEADNDEAREVERVLSGRRE